MFLNDWPRSNTSPPSPVGAGLLSRGALCHIGVIHQGPSTANRTPAVHKSDRLAGRCVLIGPFKRCTLCPKPIHLMLKGAGWFIGPAQEWTNQAVRHSSAGECCYCWWHALIQTKWNAKMYLTCEGGKKTKQNPETDFTISQLVQINTYSNNLPIGV